MAVWKTDDAENNIRKRIIPVVEISVELLNWGKIAHIKRMDTSAIKYISTKAIYC